MCVAVPGRVLSIEGDRGEVDFSGNIITVNLGFVKAKPGDYVLVHAGCAIEVIKKSQGEELLELYKEMESLFNA